MKTDLITNLEKDIYCRIKPSKKHGVGVFAIRDIPKNVNPFKITGAECVKSRVLNVKEDELKKVDPEVMRMINDFYYNDNGVYGIPYRGLNANDITYYINTSSNPNLGLVNNKNCSMVEFITLKKVKKGQELLINYDDY